MSKGKQATLFQSWGQKKKDNVVNKEATKTLPKRDQTKYEVFIDLCEDFDDNSDDALAQAMDTTLQGGGDGDNQTSLPVCPSTSWSGYGSVKNPQDVDEHNISLGAESISDTPGLSQMSAPEGFDKTAGKLWIYPTNYPVRNYQHSIVQQALLKNTLVTLPTGLGKTFIASVVMYNFYRWYPQGKVVFMAPTKPLVAQQIEACYNIMGIPQTDTAEMTGTMPPTERKRAWHVRRVFFLTPQVLTNDLSRGTCPADNIKCLVIDEAHKAQGNHAYCQVVRELIKYTQEFRVLALSATPGTDIKSVQQVLVNLLISHIELRTEDSVDIKQYSHERKVEKIVVPLGEELNMVKKKYIQIMDVVVSRLKRQGVIYNRDTTSLSKFLILKAREGFRQNPPQRMPQSQYGVVEGDFALAMSLFHGFELLQLHGLRSLYNFLEGIVNGDKGYGRTRTELTRNADFKDVMGMLQEKFDPGASQCTQGGSKKPFVTGHPKMQKLQSVVLDHFDTFCKDNSVEKKEDIPTRIMIFSQYRDSVNEITDMLKQHWPVVKAMSFIGQSSTGKSSKGLTQKEQLLVMKKFREGGFNTLVSTCVGEEGLDIGEVDLIICFDAHKSPIRLVQRMGRTGRKRQGRIIMLVTEGKEEQIYNQSQYSKTSIHKAIKNGAKSLQFYKSNPRMVPDGWMPSCHKMYISVNQAYKPNKPIVEKGNQDVKSTKVKAATSKDRDDEDDTILTELEYEELKTKIVPTSEMKVLPSSKFLSLGAEDEHEEETRVNQLSLNEWMPWQNRLHPEQFIDHSNRTKDFVEIVQFIELQQALDPQEDSYGAEMRLYLNEEDIFKTGSANQDGGTGIRKFCVSKEKGPVAKSKEEQQGTTNRGKKVRRSETLPNFDESEDEVDGDHDLPVMNFNQKDKSCNSTAATDSSVLLNPDMEQEMERNRIKRKSTVGNRKSIMTRDSIGKVSNVKSTRSSRDFGSLCNDTSQTTRRKSKIKRTSKLIQDIAETNENDFCEENEETVLQISDSITRSEDLTENIEKCVPVDSEKTEDLTSVSVVNEGQSMDTEHMEVEVEMETKNDVDDEAVSVYSHLLSRLGVVSCPVTQEKSSTSPDEERSCIKTPPPIEEIEEIVNSLSDKLPPIDLLELTEKWDREKLPETPSSKAWKRHSIEEDNPSTSKHMKDRRKMSVPEQDVKVCKSQKRISFEREEINTVQNGIKTKGIDEYSVSDNEFDTDVKAQSTSSAEVTNSKLGKSYFGENMDNSLSAVNVSELESANTGITDAVGSKSESANTKLSDTDDEKLEVEHKHDVSDIDQPDNADEDLDINEELQTQVNFGLDLDFQDNEDMDENDEIINLSPKPVFEQSVNASLFEDTFCDNDSLRHQKPVACNKDSEMESQFTFTQALACIHDSEGTQEMDIVQENAKETKIETGWNVTKSDSVIINKKSDTSQEVMDVPDACASDTDSRDFLVGDKTYKETPRYVSDNHDAQETEMMEDEDIEFPQFDLGFDIDEDIIPPSPCTSQSFSQKSFSKCTSQNLMMKSKRSLGLTSVQGITDKMKSDEMEKHQSTIVEEEDEEVLNVELATCMKSNSENGDIQRTPLQIEDNDSLLNCSDDDSYTLDRAPTESERHSPSLLIRGTHVDITATEKLHPSDGNSQKSSSPSIKHSAKQPGEPCSSESDLDDSFIVTKKKKKAPIIISPSTQENKRDKDFSSTSISDDSFEVKRKKKRNVLFSPPHINMVRVKTPVGSILSKRSNENMRPASSSSDEANKQGNSKFMVSFNLPDIISDDDDFENDLSKIKKQYKDTLKEHHKARDGKEAARNHSRKTKNTRSSLNAFIEDEAEVSEDEEVSSDDERGDLDHYEDSFIGDATQMSQGTREDMQVMYMKSVKSPLNHAGRFKLKYGNYDMDVFSQMPPEEESQYMEDSFCVGSDYEDTCVDKLEDDSCLDEVTRLDLADISCVGRRTRWSKPVRKTNKVKKDQSSKRRRIKTMADSSSEDECNRLETTSRLASIGEEIHDLGVEKKRRKIFSSSASSEDDIRNMKMCKTSPNRSSDDSRFLKKSTVQEKTDVIGNLCDTESRFAKSCKIKLTPDRTKISSDIIDTEICNKSVVNVGEGIDSEKEKRLQRQREKQAEFKRKLAEKQQMDKSAISMATGNVQYNSTNDKDITGKGDDSEDFLLNYSKTDPSADKKPVILVDSREINGSQDIISILRFQHDVKVVAAQLQGCDYIVSNRMGVDRKQWCEFSNGSNRDKLTERIHMLCKLYDRPCLIIEKDRVKEGEKDSNRPVHWTKYVDKTLVNLIMCKVSLYFTENQKETATMLADLCKLEQRKLFSISVPCDLTEEKQNQLKFYLSIPYVTQVIGLNLCHNFKSISEFVNSGLIGIRKKGCVSQERASQIHSYLRRTFDSQLLPTSNK